MNIIIVGCGRVGSQLATLFSDNSDEVTVVDTNAASFASLGRGFDGRRIVGVGFDEEVLLGAGIEECDVLVAVTDIDNTNLMIAEVGRKLYGVPHVLTRLYNPGHKNAYLQLGLDYVCGTELVAEEMYAKIVAGHSSHIDTFGDYEVLRFSLDLSEIEGDGAVRAAVDGSAHSVRSIRVGALEREHEIRIVVFERADGTASSIPNADSVLHDGDIVIACVRKDLIEDFSRYMHT
ncbi:MAG: TrkA family potassium uptake protein [Coriobacteriales bacterium]|jgi:trk system potassium uptake protein TrkA|nr:TrkA family potassium uptake protein [Coriobacteriales bacterium]